MNITNILDDKLSKSKEKTDILSKLILNQELSIDELIKFAENSKDPIKATCIESMQIATKIKPDISTLSCLEFVSKTLSDIAPRVKWESAEVIGNIAHLYPNNLEEPITNLLINTEHQGTVVRWSAAFALGQILIINTKLNHDLIPAIESICLREEKNSIKKIYLKALKKVKK